MKNDQALRRHLTELLTAESAHANFETAVKNVPARVRGTRPRGGAHSPWEILEHLRITQWDILEFSRNPKHVSPEFPAGYWPSTQAPPSEAAWNDSIKAFRADLRAMLALVTNESTDLFAPIPHGTGQTILREALLTADHNSYHLGQLVTLLRVLDAWS